MDKEARRVLRELGRENKRRDAKDPIVAYLGGTITRPERYCVTCGPRHLDTSAPVRLADFAAIGTPNGLCHDCDQPLLRP